MRTSRTGADLSEISTAGLSAAACIREVKLMDPIEWPLPANSWVPLDRWTPASLLL